MEIRDRVKGERGRRVRKEGEREGRVRGGGGR